MNGQGGFVGMMPGQRSNIPDGGKGELPIFRSWMHNLYWYDLLTVTSVLWEIWTLGPHLTIAVATLALLWFFHRYKWLCLFLALLSTMMIAMYYEPLFDVWPKIFSLSPDQLPWVFWGLALIPAPLWWRVWWTRGQFRNSVEITDKYYPGTIGIRPPGGGAVGPDNPYGDNGLMEETPPEQPAPQREKVIVITEERQNGNLRNSQRHEMSELLEAKMSAIARLALDLQTPFSEPQMAGRGKPLSSKTFAPVRDELLDLGALEWKDEDARTVRWTIAGLDLCRQFNSHRPTPP